VKPDKEDHGVVGARGLMLLVETTGKCPEQESQTHTASGKKEREATVEAFDEESAADRNKQIENGLSGSDDETFVLAIKTSVDIETGRVV
jgi:hypothetical protein